VLMPTEDSQLLTRELFYTAVTRAKGKARVVGSDVAVRAAIDRLAVRAIGLRVRLRQSFHPELDKIPYRTTSEKPGSGTAATRSLAPYG
jgi:hypothetical protein